MIPFTPDERRAQFAPSQNVGGPVDPDILDIIGERPQPTMAQQVEYEVPEVKPVDPDVLDIVNQSQGPMMASLMGASRVNPDQAAEAKRLGSQIGVGQDIALRNLEDVRKRAFMADIQRRDIARANPVLAGFLSDPTFANEASDDIGALEQIGSFFADVGRAVAGQPLQYIPMELARGYMRGQLVAERGEIGTRAIMGEAEDTNFERAKQIQEEMRGLSGGGILASTAEVVAQNVAQAREVVGTGLIGGAAGSVIPGLGTMAGFAGGIGTGVVLTTGKIEAGNMYLDMKEQGISDDTAIPVALGAGLLNGVIEAVGMKIAAAPFRQLANRVMREQIAEAVRKPTMRAALAQAGKAYAMQVGTEATEEGLQEIVNIAGEELAKGMEGIDSETTMRGAAKRVLDSFVQGAMGSAILGGIGPGANLYVDLRRASKATKQTQFFNDLVQTSAESKLKARDAGAYERFVAATADGTGADTIFVDGATMRDVLSQAGVTDAQLEAIVPGLAQQVRQAAEQGNDVTIPTAQFAARLAGTKLGDGLLPHMRLSPDAMSATEAQQFEQNREALVEEARALLESKTEAESAFVQEADQVATTMRERLIAAGRDPALAEVESLVHQAFVVTQAARQGKTPAQFEAESGLREIVGAEMSAAPLEQANQFDQAGQRRTDTPEFKTWSNDAPVIANEQSETHEFTTGTPVVVEALHGSTERGLRRFDVGRAVEVPGAIFFTSNPAVAEQYTYERAYGEIISDQPTGDVIRAYVAFANPMVYQPKGKVVDAIEMGRAIEQAKAAGHDGLIIKNIDDSIGMTGDMGDVYVTWNPSSIKSVDNRGTWSRTTANIMEQAAVPAAFYSALGRAIDGIDIKSASASGWKERIKGLVNKGDIKQDELTWSGLEDWLSLPREGKITKEEVADFLKNNGVRVERVTLQDVRRITREGPLFYVEGPLDVVGRDAPGWFVRDADGSIEEGPFDSEAEAEQVSQQFEAEASSKELAARPLPTKYAQYTLPGGTNYREVLLTLPVGLPDIVVSQNLSAPGEFEFYELTFAGISAGRNLAATVVEKERGSWRATFQTDQTTRDSKESAMAWAKAQMSRAAPQIKKLLGFKSAHWDQPNIVAHLRMNDRVDADGKRVLFVEEIQSDWAQAGRKKGFFNTALRNQRIAELERIKSEAERAAEPYTSIGQDAPPNILDRWNAAANELSRIQNQTDGAIPIAPFVARQQFAVFKGDKEVTRKNKEGKEVKQRYSSMKAAEAAAAKVGGEARDIGMQADTEGWVNLALKQIMLEAVNGGYDSVAFINGEQSKDRYDLAKQVRLVSVNKQADGRYLTYIEGIDGTALIRNRDGFSDAGQKAMTAEELEATVGKEVATQAIEGKPNKEGWVDVRGDNLRVGGEGMVAFYDKIVPAATSKLLEKLDGGKLGEIRLPYMLPKQMEADADRLGMTQADILEVAGEEDAYSQNQAGFDVTDALREKIASGLPLFQAMPGRGPARGGYDPSRLKILFGKGADFTTGAHELTHYYVDYYTKQAMVGTAAPQMLADLDIMFKFMGVAGATPDERLAAFNAMPFETARPLIETITYNAEIYMFEGKAPSLELAGVFDRMLAFFRRAYKSIADFVTQQREIYRREFGRELPELSDELRQVFDRMLADERQIKQAQAVAQMRGQFTVKPEGMDDAEWAAYQEMAGEATNAAIADMTKASLRQMEWLSRARSRIIKDMQARHTAQRKEVRERVQRDVQQDPLYRAMSFLRRGQVVAPDGTVTEAEGVHRIDRVLAAEFAPTVDLTRLGGRFGVLQDDGLHPDIVAEMFGYRAGATLLQDLADAKPMREVVEDRTDAEMLRLYGEMNTPAAREQEIQKALHNEARARLVGVELRFMGKIQQPVRVLLEAARQASQQAIGRRRIVEIRPSEFVAAEAKASREVTAAMQENKPDAAVRAKRAQLLNNQLAKAALEAKDEIDAALKDFRKFFRADSQIADSRDLAMVMAARSILASRGIGQSDKAPSAYIEQLKANNPGVYAELEPIITQGGVGDYRQMTVAEFRVLAESVNALWTRARRDRQIQVEDRKVALDTVITELKEALSKITRPEVQPGVSKAVGPADVAKRRLMEIRAAARRIEPWSDAIDGSDPNRPFTTYVWQPVRDATTRFRQIRNDKIKILDGLVRGLTMPTKSIAAPELGYTFGAGNSGVGKAELLGAMLHTGNISNYRKLLLGRGWASMDDAGNMNDANWRRFVARMISEGILTKEDFDFLQAVWDLNEDIKPLLQKTHYDLEGYYFKEVPTTPVVTPFGTYRGGYVPAATDKFMVADAAQKAGMEELEQDWRFSLPSTGMGMTKSRVESYLRPLALDVRQTVAHVDAALRFAIIQPAISDALKILKNRSFAAELNAIDPTAISDMLLPWLNRAARQTVSQPGRSRLMDAVWTGVRTRTGMAIMFGNIRNALQNLTGYFPAALKVKPTYLKNAMATYLGSPRETASMIAATDPFMDQRMRDQVYEMQERMNDLLINPSKFAKIKAWNKQHAYFLQTAFQNQVDIVVWLGAYNQSLAESGIGVAEDKARKQAIRDAGAAVRLTQGSMLPEDIAAFEAGTPFYRTFTQFASYFNGIANLNATEFIKTVRAMGFRGGKGKLLYIYMLGVMMPAIVSDAIVRSLGGGWEDDDEDGYLDVYMDWFFGSQLRMGAAFVPFGASAYRLVAAPFTTETYDDRMTSSPSVSAIEAATVGTGKAIINVFDEEKEVTGKNVRDVLTAISLATGVPVSAAGKPIGYLVDVARGKIEPEGPIDFVRGLVTGTATPSSRRR